MIQFEKVEKEKEVIQSTRPMTVKDLRRILDGLAPELPIGHFEHDMDIGETYFRSFINFAKFDVKASNTGLCLKMTFGERLV